MPVKSIERQIMDRGVLGNMPRWGKLRKGGEKPDGKIGRDLNYFRLTLEPEHEDVREAFEALYGPQPDTLHQVMIAADSADAALDYWYEEWAHARLVKRCDEETISVGFNEGEMRYDTTPHACTCNPLDRTCGLVGRLDIVIPALCEALGKWGKLTVLTGSVYDVTALRASMHLAGAFMQRHPDFAFWSVPFTIGRAMRTVPVTINKKRSLKPMSLLYAQVDQDFNRTVFAPQLTAPAQLMLAGMNPSTGEMPDMIIEQAAAWDRDYVNEQTLHLFDHEVHQQNAIDKMIADGLLLDDMTDTQALQVIAETRAQRDAEKQAEAEKPKSRKNGTQSNDKAANSSADAAQAQPDLGWMKNPQTVSKFIKAAIDTYGVNHGQIIQALRWVTDDHSIENIEDFKGTKETAWAACLIHACAYNTETVKARVADASNPTRTLALQILENMADIPF